MANVLITGAKGQLGTDLVTILSQNHEVKGTDIDAVDIRNADEVKSLVQRARPDVVIHAAAYTDVDRCEGNADEAMAINATGTKNVAMACQEIGAKLIYYSTDYVFDGSKQTPYVEEDLANPQTVYGLSKLHGEEWVRQVAQQFTILRIAWVYGTSGRNFVRTMLKIGKEQLKAIDAQREYKPIRVVADQIGNPTWTEDIAYQTQMVMERELFGTYHATSEGSCSWFELAKEVFNVMKMPVKLEQCTTAEFPRPAKRPANSALTNAALERVGANRMRPYQIALWEFLGNHGKAILDEV